MPEILCHQLTKKFESGVEALAHLTLEIDRGDFVCLLGPSGCGKSTLLRLVAELETPTSGRIEVAPPPAKQFQAPIGYVFQEPHLLPWRNILENVSLPLELLKAPHAMQTQRALEALKLVGLSDFCQAYPHELSGGMKMKASLARALVASPSILLLDEPFGALDETSRFRLDLELREIWRQLNLTVIFVTHSIFEAAFLAERVIVLSARPGRLTFDKRLVYTETRDRSLKSTMSYLKHVQEISHHLEAVA